MNNTPVNAGFMMKRLSVRVRLLVLPFMVLFSFCLYLHWSNKMNTLKHGKIAILAHSQNGNLDPKRLKNKVSSLLVFHYEETNKPPVKLGFNTNRLSV